MIKIQFLGAAKTVTGSSFLVTSDNCKFLVDCGMFQGQDVEERNTLPLEFDPKDLDFVVITHAHIDHIGLLPKLVRFGFSGAIYMTPETSALAYHLLLDAAKIQEKGNSRGQRQTPLYETRDAFACMKLVEGKRLDEEFTDKGCTLRFEQAGHVLGAASLVCEVDDKRLCFSGDLGRSDHPFLSSFDPYPRKAEFVVVEALYGGVLHDQRAHTVDRFLEEIDRTLVRDGNVIIPTFALQRTQEILYTLKFGYQEDRISRKVPVFLDSPLAENITRVYSQSLFLGDVHGQELFNFEQLRIIKRRRRMPRNKKGPYIVLAGSGMCEGGRIQSHLAKGLPDKKNSIMIVGYQAEGTRGRELINRPKKLRINKRSVNVRAQTHEFYGFSAHADHADLTRWLGRFDRDTLRQIFLVHAEPKRMEDLVDKSDLKNITYIPDWKEEVVLS